jgi:hypothetical protein
MMSFDAYRWEDHVPRNGSWKFNLAVAALAVGLIATALPDERGQVSSFAGSAAKPAQDIGLSTYGTPSELHPLPLTGRARAESCAPAPQHLASSALAGYGSHDPTTIARC